MRGGGIKRVRVPSRTHKSIHQNAAFNSHDCKSRGRPHRGAEGDADACVLLVLLLVLILLLVLVLVLVLVLGAGGGVSACCCRRGLRPG